MVAEQPMSALTLMFTDVESSTDMLTELGDDAAHAILRRHEQLLTAAVAGHGGRVVKNTGDGFLVSFPSAREGVGCAVALQRAHEEQNRHQPKPLRIRIGLNAGDVIEEGADFFGAPVNAAARIMAKGGGGQILVSSVVKELAEPLPVGSFVDRGMFWLKGFPERWRLYEVAWRDDEPVPTPILVSERTPFVGRQSEQADLRRCLDSALAGRGTLVLLGGEPGVGKTRMAEEIAAEGRDRGALHFVGRCYEMEGSPPYFPFVEILETAARQVAPDALRSALADSAPEVARLVPSLKTLFDDIPEPLDMPADQARHHLFRGIREFIERAGRMQPLVLLLDDIQWAEESTLLLLEHIAQHLDGMAVLILATYRETELHAVHPLARTLETLLRMHTATRVRLRRLDEAGVEGMLRAMSNRTPPAELVRTIFDETEGNAFFVEEVFKYLLEEGKLFDETGDWRSGLRIEELEVPETIRLVVDRRLRRLSETTMRVLTAAAVTGRAFAFDLLQPLTGSDEDALLDALDEAERAHLVTSSVQGNEVRFSFSHELIRHTLLSGVSTLRRRRLHRRVAEAMETVYASRINDYAADIAHHLLEGGEPADPERAVGYLGVAADRALAAAAFEDATQHVETALALVDPADRKTRAELFVKLGLARRSLGNLEEALRQWYEALPIFEELADGARAAEICRQMAYLLVWVGRYGEGHEVAQRGLRALGTQRNADRGRLLSVGGYSLSHAGDFDGAERLIGEAFDLASELGDDRLLGDCLHLKAQHHYSFMQPGPAYESAEPAVTLLRSTDALWDLAIALGYVQWSLFHRPGQLDRAAAIASELEELARRLGHFAALVVGLRNRSVLEFAQTGDLAELRRAAERDIELCRGSGIALYAYSLTWLGLIEAWHGNDDAALEHFQSATDVDTPGAFAPRHLGFLYRHLAEMGRVTEAHAFSEEIRKHLPKAGRANTIGSWTLLLTVVEGLVASGRHEDAAEMYPLVVAAIATGTVWRLFDCRLLQTVAGIAAGAGKDWQAAEEHFRTALDEAHQLPVVLEQAEVRRFYAAMLTERKAPGDLDRAAELLGDAAVIYQRMGMAKHAEGATATLQALTSA